MTSPQNEGGGEQLYRTTSYCSYERHWKGKKLSMDGARGEGEHGDNFQLWCTTRPSWLPHPGAHCRTFLKGSRKNVFFGENKTRSRSPYLILYRWLI